MSIVNLAEIRELRELEAAIANPFSIGDSITLKVDNISISALNFINDYKAKNGNPVRNGIDGGIALFQNLKNIKRIDILNKLKELDTSKADKTFPHTFSLDTQTQVLYFNQIINEFPNQDYGAISIGQEAIANYIKVFISSFQSFSTQANVRRHKEALRLQRIKNPDDTTMIQLLESTILYPHLQLGFFPVSRKDKWSAYLFQT